MPERRRLLLPKPARRSRLCGCLLVCLSTLAAPFELPAEILPGDTGPLHLEIFTPEEHGVAPLSNKITEDSRGNIYVANQDGTLCFDGMNWEKLPATGHNTFTSALHIDQQERIWVGGDQHLGYYESGPTGKLSYHDRSEAFLKELEGQEIGIIWNIFSNERFTYVITNFHVAWWDGEKWKHHNFDVDRRILPTWLDGELYVHARGSGLLHIDGERIESLLGSRAELSGGIMRLLSIEDGDYLLATVDGRVFQIEKAETGEGGAELQSICQSNQSIYASVLLDDGSIALAGSRKIEILGRDGAGNVWDNSEIGHVYDLHESADGSIWAASTRSLLRIPPQKYSRFERQYSELTRTNGGLYGLDENRLDRLRLEGAGAKTSRVASDTVSYNLVSLGRHLVYSKREELALLRDGAQFGAKPISRAHTRLYESRAHEDIFYSSETPEASRWQIHGKGMRRLNQTRNSRLTFASIIDLNPDQSIFSTFDNRIGILHWPEKGNIGAPPRIEMMDSGNGLAEELVASRLLPVGGHVLLISDQGLFLYEKESGRFRHIDELGEQIVNFWSDFVYCLSADGEGIVLYTKEDRLPAGYRMGMLRLDETGEPLWHPIKLPGLSDGGLVRTLLHEVQDGREILWVGGSKALFRYDLTDLDSPPRLQVNLTSIRETTSGRVFYGGYGPLPGKTEWPYPQKSLRIDYAAPPAALKAKSYQTRLRGFNDNWSEPSDVSFRELSNLREGNYTFEVRAIDEFGRGGPVTRFGFAILPPWYRTPYAYAGYLLLVIASFLLIARLWTQHLRRRNLELEALVSQRTGELKQRNQELIEANAVKQDFLAGMSHEIRNPLNGILGIAQLLGQEPGANATRVSHLNACATHLHQLLGQVLDFSSIESGKLETRPVAFDPKQLIQEVAGMHQILAEKKGLALKLSIEKTDRLWIGDPVLLRQVLINLVSNAIKYTPSGAVRLGMVFESQNESLRAKFTVEDTGPGIPEDKRDYIFKDFTRLSRAGESEVAGTGLGLAIARQMAELMRGSLCLDETYRDGARFLLELPFDTGGKIRARQTTQRRDAAKPLLGKQVLVADDMDFNRYICRELLEKLGARVTEAEDGRLALEALEKNSFEIAILDINMPVLNGNQVVRRFLDGHAGAPPLFVALTAHVTARMEKEALEAGFQQFIEKPLDPDQIVRIALAQPLREKKANAPDLLSYLAGSDEGSKSRMQARYLKSMREQIEALQACIAAQNNEAAKATLHKLRGLANMQRSADVMARIEQLSVHLSSGGDPGAALAKVRQLEALLNE